MEGGLGPVFGQRQGLDIHIAPRRQQVVIPRGDEGPVDQTSILIPERGAPSPVVGIVVVLRAGDAWGKIMPYGEERAVELDGLGAAPRTSGHVALHAITLGNLGGFRCACNLNPAPVPECTPPLLMRLAR